MGNFRTKEDDVAKISTSIFVSNFPEVFSAKDLFHACKQYGHVVDSFIPSKRSKDGKRFGFVRFINVFSVERLVSNLCTIWVGRSKFQANVARFHRTPLKNNKASKDNVYEPKSKSIVNENRVPSNSEGSKGDTANSHDGINFDDVDDVDKVPETELDETLEQNKSPSEDPFEHHKFPPSYTPWVSMQEDIGRNVNDVTSPKRIVEEEQNEQEWNNANKGSKDEMSVRVSVYCKTSVAPQSQGVYSL
ncbi:nucleotide-binding alpha-beta plait domain-containing protein [Tanacetum coccineum]